MKPCRIFLRTYGINPNKHHPISSLVSAAHPSQSSYVGTLFGQPVYDWEGSSGGMELGSWILILGHGVRHIQSDEMIKLKGINDRSYVHTHPKVLISSVEQHMGASICKVISPLLVHSPLIRPSTHTQITTPYPTPYQ